MTTWIVSTQAGCACVYEQRTPDTAVELITVTQHPASTGWGKPFMTGRLGCPRREDLAARPRLSRRVAAEFARSLADDLRRGRLAGEFSQLVLVADRRALELLRDALDKDTAARVIGELVGSFGVYEHDALADAIAPLLEPTEVEDGALSMAAV